MIKKSLTKTVIKHMATGKDGVTYDPARIYWAIGLLFVLIASGYQLYKTEKFDVFEFSIAYAGLLAGGAAGVKFKESSEPGTYRKPKVEE